MATGYWEAIYNDLMEKKAEYDRQLLDELNRVTQEAVEDSYREYGDVYKIAIESNFRNAVWDFYDAYSPSLYDRQYGLYEVLDIQYDDRGIPIDTNNYKDLFSEENLHRDRKGNSLYEKVFIDGWHGGAENINKDADIWGVHPSPGTPYYRKPGFVRIYGRSYKYGKWGRKAIRTKSAYKMFVDDMARDMPYLDQEEETIARRKNRLAVEHLENDIMPALAQSIFSL